MFAVFAAGKEKPSDSTAVLNWKRRQRSTVGRSGCPDSGHVEHPQSSSDPDGGVEAAEAMSGLDCRAGLDYRQHWAVHSTDW